MGGEGDVADTGPETAASEDMIWKSVAYGAAVQQNASILFVRADDSRLELKPLSLNVMKKGNGGSGEGCEVDSAS